jgi:hypothetical protein
VTLLIFITGFTVGAGLTALATWLWVYMSSKGGSRL